jgi:peptidoglycan/LPS O-acetylase OafA/YrhL
LPAVPFFNILRAMKVPYLKQLDGIRAIAALLVLALHFFTWNSSNSALTRILGHYAVIGQTGVTLFFVLSGFLITRILLVSKENPHYFSSFYVRRLLRIFPLYYLFLTVTYFVVPVWQHVSVPSFSGQLYFWVYLQDFVYTFNWRAAGPPHTWSLAVEEHFYLLWPMLVYFLGARGIKISVVVILFLALGCRLLLIHHGLEVFYFTFTRMDDLAIGALLAVWEAEGKLKNSGRKFAIGLVLMIIPTFLLWKDVTGKALPDMQVIKSNLVAFCSFCVVGFAIALRQSNVIYKLLSSRFFTFTGKISYGIYVYHPLCFLVIEHYFPTLSLVSRLVTGVSVVYLVSSASYFLFEAKFIGLKKYFSYDKGRPATKGSRMPATETPR